MDNENVKCQYNYEESIDLTLPDNIIITTLRKNIRSMRRHQSYRNARKWIRRAQARIQTGGKVKKQDQRIKLELNPGDTVEVLSEEEIRASLDKRGKLTGLTFMHEMRKFCGKRFKIYKKVNKILIETTGELRTLRSPTYLLNGVICDGKSHRGCDRSCFCLWRESWLKKIEP